MTTRLPNANVWVEPSGPSDALPLIAGFYNAGSDYELSTTEKHDAALLDWHGDRAEYELLLIGSPYVLVDVGGGALSPSASGTPAGILIDDGSGGLEATPDVTQTEAGRWYPAANGSLVAVRFDAPEYGILSAGGNYIGFESR